MSTDNNSISIVVPMYNVENYIEDCLRSIMNQLQDTDEIIIIDDGSTDRSYEICRHMVDGKKNIVLIHQENNGRGAARNRGISISKGQYVLFVDSDDMLRQNAISELRNIAAERKPDLLFFSADIRNECGYEIRTDAYDRPDMPTDTLISGKALFLYLFPRFYSDSSCLMLYRKSFLWNEKLIFTEEVIHEDVLFTFQAIMRAQRTLCVREKYYIRRCRPNSAITSDWDTSRWFGLQSAYVNIWRYLKGEADQLFEHQALADAVAAYSFKTLKNLFEMAIPDSAKTEGYSDEYIINVFLQTWILYYEYGKDSIIKWKGSLYIANLLQKRKLTIIDREILTPFSDVTNLMEKYRCAVIKKLRQLPLDRAGVKVGIYGKGNCAQKLIERYHDLIGEIVCDYIFVDSYVEDEDEVYLDRPVINIKKVTDNVDVIIISSCLYQDDMNYRIDETLGTEFPRITLYDIRDETGYFWIDM